MSKGTGGSNPSLCAICRCGGMADATDSKSVVGDNVLVQVQSPAPSVVVNKSFGLLTTFYFTSLTNRYSWQGNDL